MTDQDLRSDMAAVNTEIRHLQAAIEKQTESAERRTDRMVKEMQDGRLETLKVVGQLGVELRADLNKVRSEAESRDADLAMKIKTIELAPAAGRWNSLMTGLIGAAIAGIVAFFFASNGKV